MALVPDISFVTKHPEFASVAEARIQLFLDDALLEIREADWGIFHIKALQLMTAHLLTLGNATSGLMGGSLGSNGPIASRGIGDTSVSFSTASNSSNISIWLDSTPYGQELARLVKVIGADMLVV